MKVFKKIETFQNNFREEHIITQEKRNTKIAVELYETDQT